MTDPGTEPQPGASSVEAAADPSSAAPARTIGRSSMVVAAGTAASRLTGFARVFVLGYAIGQDRLADLYTMANSAPNLVFELVVGGVLSATLVPLFVTAREDDDRESASVLLSVGFVMSAALALVALLVAFGFDRGITAYLNGTGNDETDALRRLEIITDFLYLLLPQVLFYGITSLTTGYLNAARRYRTAAFAPVLTNVVCIAAFIAVGYELQGRERVLAAGLVDGPTILWLGLGTTAGVAAMAVPLMWEVGRNADLEFLPRFRHNVVNRVIRLSGWTFGYVAANQLALLVVIALLDDNKRYSDAFIFFQLPHGLIAVSIMTTMTPELASAATRADYAAMAQRFTKGLRLMVALIVPAAIGYVLLATPITSFLKRGNLTAVDARLTAQTVVAFAVGLPAFSIYLFACRGFYALSDTRTPFLLNVVENGVNVVGVVALATMGTTSSTSFAVAYSVAYVIAAVLAVWRFARRLHQLDPALRAPDPMPLVRMVGAALGMGVAVWLVRQGLPDDAGPGAVLAVVVGVLVGGVVYLGLGLALAVEEMYAVWSGIRRRLRV